MKKIFSILSGAFLLAASLTAAFSAPVTAQGSNGYIVSPVREELVIEPGKSQTVTLTIENATNNTTVARAIVNDFEAAGDETGQPKILLDENVSAGSNSFKSLIGKLPSLNLGAHGKKQMDVTVSVPANANAGGYYGAIRFISDTGQNDKNVALSASVGTIFLVKVPGNLKESLQLVEFTAAKNGSNGRLFINSGEMTIVTRLRNDGTIHVKPFGRVAITDGRGKEIEAYEFNNVEPRANVLPNSTRKFEDKLKNKSWLGKYTVTANFGYGSSGSLITAKTTFWVIPTWFMILVGVIIVALIVGAYMLYRKYFASKQHHTRSYQHHRNRR
jgi:hypothetical protein